MPRQPGGPEGPPYHAWSPEPIWYTRPVPLGDRVRAFQRHRMRAYYLPFAAGAVLTLSAFLPLIVHGDAGVGGIPAVPALWIFALGLGAMVLAALSVITRKNSRHPLLLVGLIALSIEFLAWQSMRRAVTEQAWASEQARAIVEGAATRRPPDTTAGTGLYLGLLAALAIVGFGLTIVVKKVATPYAPPEDDAE